VNPRELEVLCAGAWGDVDDARALLEGDFVPGNNTVCDGLLGGDFLEHFTLTLDYSAKRLQLTPALSGNRRY
jgi:hypothetical protein